MKTVRIENIADNNETYSDDDIYNITSWGADLSFREIINMYDDNDLLKPELQRKYVWTKKEASRFIDSLLLGLPVPSVFFAKEANETMLIVDGYQRIMTVYDYVNGIFSKDGKVFKLFNSEIINPKWRGKSYKELTREEQRRIKNTTIHAIIFEQKYPSNDNTGMFQIFERINTGGKTLKPQEIRNCVYHGRFNALLLKLNQNKYWKSLLGINEADARMTDLELILRFFAMADLHKNQNISTKQIVLVKYLNVYMGKHCNLSKEKEKHFVDMFEHMVNTCFDLFGKNSFKNLKEDGKSFTNKINPAIFDAVSVAALYSKKLNASHDIYENRHRKLLQNETFQETVTSRTTNVDNIRKRIELAINILYGNNYE